MDKNANKLWIAGQEERWEGESTVSGPRMRRYLHGLIDGSAPTPQQRGIKWYY